MPKSRPPEDNTSLADLLRAANAPSEAAAEEAVVDDAPVHIPLEDVTIPNYSDAVQEALLQRTKLAADVATTQEVWSRASEKQVGEDDRAHQDRIKQEFEAAVLAVRRQDAQPAPPPQPVPPQIMAQTQREMEAGRKQSEYWREQQKLRPMPTAAEIKAAGTNTPVFRPGEYTHEKGSVDKNLVTQRG